MNARARTIVATLALGLCAVGASAEPSGDVLDDLPGPPSPAARLEQLEGQIEKSYEAVLAEFDTLATQSPHDVAQQVGRCEFMSQFSSSYEYAGFIEKVYSQQEECQEALAQRHPDHPEVILYGLQQTYGEEQLAEARKALERMRNQRWTNGQAARLYALLADAAESQDDKTAVDYALRALELDERSSVRLIAAKGLIDREDKARALDILSSPANASNPGNTWEQAEKLRLLAQLGASKQVAAAYAKLESEASVPRIQIARALREVGLVDLARKELSRGGSQYVSEAPIRMERFRLELEHGTPRQALEAYDSLRDLGMMHDPLGINRIAVAFRSLALPWQPRDFLGFMSIAALIVFTALAIAVPVSAVHYRGLAVRARLGEPYPTGGWQLRHAWVALVAFAVAQILAFCCSGPIDLGLSASRGWSVDLEPKQLASVVLLECFLSLALLIPLARLSGRIQPAWWGTNWPIARSLLIGGGIGLAIRLPLLVVASTGHFSVPLQDPLWSVLREVRGSLGLGAAVWVLAIAAPVLEEFIFRGVLLRALNAHISFAWANVIQAILFSAMHVDLKGLVPLFLLGALLGWLTRRSGGLAAPMALHCVFNLVAALVVLLR
jgi:membrane protease YdiL (CAAX protease family)